MRSLPQIRLNPWREIAILMMILMEVSWVTPWFKSITIETNAIDSIRVFLIFSLIALFAHIAIRIMDYLFIKKIIRRGLMIVFMIIGSFLSIKAMLYASEMITLPELISHTILSFADLKILIPVEFIIIFAVLIGFFRGMMLAQDYIGPSTTMRHFWVGILMFILYIFLVTIGTGEQPGGFFYIFLFSSLIGISSARMAVTGLVRGGRENKFNRSWFLGILIAALFIIGLTSLASGIIGDRFIWIGKLFIGLFSLVIILVWLLISPLFILILTFIVNLLEDAEFLSDLGDRLLQLIELIRRLGLKISTMFGNSEIRILITRWLPSIKTILLLSILGLIVLGVVLWIAITIWKDRERRSASNEEKLTSFSNGLLRSLLNILRQRWNRAVNSLEQLIDLRRRQRLRAAARIRQIYAELLELCESMDRPRPEAQTPLEFLPKLEEIFPELQHEVNSITQAYLRVRYGLLPETRSDIDAVEAAWVKVHNVGQVQVQENKRNKKIRTNSIKHIR